VGHIVMATLEHTIPPPAVAVLVAAGMWGVAGIGPPLSVAPGPQYIAVAVFVAVGLAFSLLGVLAFRASRTTVNPLKPERASALVTGGVYRMTRNPMYVGMAFVLLAWAVYLSAMLPFVGIAVFVAFITRLQIVPEERVLHGLFGDAYAAYAARVRRWL
jgi:protein-S-isoprenylcysteine O-methyltransferase Ste14